MSAFVIKCILFAILASFANSAKILVIVHHTAASHYIPFARYLDKLLERGHNLTVLTHFPSGKRSDNYREVSLRVEDEVDVNNKPIELWMSMPLWERLSRLHMKAKRQTSSLDKEEVQEFLKTDEKFDLIILESFMFRIYTGFVQKFPAPFMYITSGVVFPHVAYNLAEIINPSYIPSPIDGGSSEMNFWQR